MTDGPAFASEEARWAAFDSRDPQADEAFFVAVRTTRIYCRPTCPARHPLRQNVTFYTAREEAELAGFRPCLRCQPDQPGLAARRAAAVERACRLIETTEELPSLDQLAEAAGMSRYHFHRVFRGITGMTPSAYAAAHRGRRVRDSLRRSATVTEAVYEAGFNSSGRFYASSDALLGMTPSRFRAGGIGEKIRFAIGECSMGSILVAATERGICSIMLGDDPDFLARELQDRFPKAELIAGDGDFERVVASVVGFVEAPRLGLSLPLDLRGTAFQQRVWQALREVQAGSTATYAEIAARIGEPNAARAVGSACAANPVAIAVPCHRIVGRDGSLTGYRWGVERKRALLDRESAA